MCTKLFISKICKGKLFFPLARLIRQLQWEVSFDYLRPFLSCHHQHFTSVDGLSDLTNFGRSGQIFRCAADKICLREKLDKID